MASFVTVLFKGNNGLGTIDLGFNPGTALGSKVVMIQQIFTNISSGATVDILDLTGSFTSEMYHSTIEQVQTNDWSDSLLLAVIQLP